MGVAALLGQPLLRGVTPATLDSPWVGTQAALLRLERQPLSIALLMVALSVPSVAVVSVAVVLGAKVPIRARG